MEHGGTRGCSFAACVRVRRLLWVCVCVSVSAAAAVRPRGALLEFMLAGAAREEAERGRVASTNKVGGVC